MTKFLQRVGQVLLAVSSLLVTGIDAQLPPAVVHCRPAVEALLGTPEFATYYLATGHSLPMDAGKYATCHSLPNARYFLVSMKAKLSASSPATPLQMGFCVPNVCDTAGMIELVTSPIVQAFIPPLYVGKSLVSDVKPASSDFNLESPDAASIVCCIILGVIVCVALVSTGIVLSPSQSQMPAEASATTARQGTNAEELLRVEEGGQAASPSRSSRQGGLASSLCVKAFSLFGSTGTLTKLVEPAPYKPTDCLNGARVLSMAGIILGHTYIMPMGISGYANTEDIINNTINSDVAENNWLFQAVIGSQTGVDTFFYLSGFLLAHLTMKEIRAGKMMVIPAIILRYLRLTPSLALVMMVYYKIWAYLGNGPFAVQLQRSIISRCRDSWWTELTYTMNFVPFDSDKVCMGWSWYLGDDMIFFLITIVLLPIHARNFRVGWCSVITLTLLSFALTSYFMVKHNLGIYAFGQSYVDYSYWVYSKPYSRIPAYFVGTVTAWLLDAMEKRGITRDTKPTSAKAHMLASVAAVGAVGLLLFIIFIPATNFGKHAEQWGVALNTVFVNLARPLFAIGWAVITLLCYYDYVPLLNGFLAHPCWTPLARLTYGAYLVHPLVIKLSAGNAPQFYTFNSMDLLYRWTGNAVLTTLGSVALWTLCERPCMTIFSPTKKGKKARPAAQAKQDADATKPQDDQSLLHTSAGDSTTPIGSQIDTSPSSQISLPPRSDSRPLSRPVPIA